MPLRKSSPVVSTCFHSNGAKFMLPPRSLIPRDKKPPAVLAIVPQSIN